MVSVVSEVLPVTSVVVTLSVNEVSEGVVAPSEVVSHT